MGNPIYTNLLTHSFFDRGYPSYFYLTLLLAHRQHFIGRCSKGSFPAAQKLFRRPVPSKRVMLRAPHYLRPKLLALGLPLTIAVRFVTVILKTGEVEVLVTSLLDETLYPASEFGPLYYLRWGVETFYGRVKGRLALENFTGKTPEAIKQDFYSTILNFRRRVRSHRRGTTPTRPEILYESLPATGQ